MKYSYAMISEIVTIFSEKIKAGQYE